MKSHLILAGIAVVTAVVVVAVSSTDASAATRRPLVLANTDGICGDNNHVDNGRIQMYRQTDLRRRHFNNCADRVINRSRTFWVLENNRDYRAKDVCIRPRSRANLTAWRFGNLLSYVYIMPGDSRRQKRNFCRRFTSDGIIGRRL
jgi:hypothetical protein